MSPLPWVWPGEIQRAGVLGINARNADYILVQNPRLLYPRVDDKVITKGICKACEIRVPDTYAVFERHGDIARLGEIVAARQEFVVKPARGSGGRGIVVIAAHDGETFETLGGPRWTSSEMRYHISTILSGLYSLAGQHDRAIIERRIICHPVFARVAVGGTPDIRVILYRGVPAMTMTRLPTVASRGRANLHQGAVAAAIDMATGKTSGGVVNNRTVSTHPDTGESLEGFEIPGWNEIMLQAIRLADDIGLGYLGIDFVVEAELGPVVLEANARPGLAIQIANRRGLVPRLRWIDENLSPAAGIEERRAMADRLAAL